MVSSLIISLIVLLISLCLSAFFSMTETAITSITNLKAKHMQEEGGRGTHILNLWISSPQRILAALLISNNMVNIFASVYADNVVREIFGTSSVALVTATMTITIVLFSEILPKTIARNFAMKIAVPALNIFRIFYLVLYPVTIAMTFISNTIQKLFLKNHTQDPQITEEELEFLMSIGEKEGVIAEQKHDMISGIFELGDTVVREIMVHRIDLVAVPATYKITDIIEKFRDTGLSRILIYEDKIDNIIGMTHAKDALFYLKKHSTADTTKIHEATVLDIKREVMFIPETKPVDQLFQEMRRQKQHMAVVLDEYGGTSGIVTMEDVFEEIMGEVRDEFDNEEDAIRPTQVPNQYLVECKIHIDDFCDFFELDSQMLKAEDNANEFDTLAGYMLNHFGAIPKTGDTLSMQSISLEVVEVSKRRVRRVVVRTVGEPPTFVPPLEKT
jgi:putative hemolysin